VVTPRFVLAVGVLAVAASCARPGEPASRPSPTGLGATSPGPATTATAPSPVPGELRFTAPRLGGGTVQGAVFAGRDLVMWFWAPW
jgi:hypothetical protein